MKQTTWKTSLKNIILTTLSCIVMMCASPIIVPLYIMVATVAWINYLLLKLRYGKGVTAAYGNDIIYGLEKPNSTLFVNHLSRFEGNITFDHFRKHVWNRYQMNDKPIHSRRLRRFQQRYLKVAGYQYFVDDLYADMDYHIVEITKEDLYSDPPLNNDPNAIESFICEEESKDEFQLITDHVMKKYGDAKMDKNKPQWRIFFYKQENSFTYLFRFNHVIIDGINYWKFILAEFGEKSVMYTLPFQFDPPGMLEKAVKMLWAYLLLPYYVAGAVLRDTPHNSLHGPKLSGKKIQICDESFPLAKLKEIKDATKMSFNNILFSCAAYALRCHYRSKGNSIPKTYAMFPTPLQDTRKSVKTENCHGMMPIMLHTEAEDIERDSAIERLRIIANDMDVAEKDASYQPVQLIIRLLAPVVPYWINNNVLFNPKGITITLSNMPGPRKEGIQIGDAYSKDMIFWSADREPIGINIAFMGHLQHLRVGLHVDTALMKTKKEAYGMLENLHKEIDNLRRELGLDVPKRSTEVKSSE